MSVPQVEVYLLASEPSSAQTARVSNLFSSPLFSVNVMVISRPANLDANSKISEADQIENYRILWCLNDARSRHPDSYVLIIKDTSVSDASPERIADVVSGAIKSGRDDPWDVFYLSKWMDRCDLYGDMKPINGTMTSIAKSKSPKGLQAVVFSPAGRDSVLNASNLLDKALSDKVRDAVVNGNLKAIVAVPNLIRYDINAAKTGSDYEKVNECAIVPVPSSGNGKQLQEVTTTNSNGLWLLLLLIIILIVIGFFLLKRQGML